MKINGELKARSEVMEKYRDTAGVTLTFCRECS